MAGRPEFQVRADVVAALIVGEVIDRDPGTLGRVCQLAHVTPTELRDAIVRHRPEPPPPPRRVYTSKVPIERAGPECATEGCTNQVYRKGLTGKWPRFCPTCQDRQRQEAKDRFG